MNNQSDFQRPVKTTNGPGVLWGRGRDGLLLVSHKPADVPEAVRVEYGRGGPCFCVWYDAGEVSGVGAGNSTV